MSSILLGSLAYQGLNNSKKPKQRARNVLDSIYHSDIENKMNNIEHIQSRQNFSNSAFLNQFDDLRFDNTNQPVGVNDGENSFLQRNLDFQQGYSSFQSDDMHYDVVSKEHFVHNNMMLNTARRDYAPNTDRTLRKLETFTGVNDHYTPRKEREHLFEPMADLTWVNGMPVVTGEFENRYIPSNKNNNGNLPFQHNIRVKPGIQDQNQEGNYAVYRIEPRNIDALRSEINQKVVYLNKPFPQWRPDG